MTSQLESKAGHSVHKRHGIVKKLQARASSATCTDSGDLYVTPAPGANIDSARQTTISWNSACLNSTSQIDIYLYAPLEPSANLPIHAWTHVPASAGSYSVKLAPKWWNATSSVELSLNIVPSGNQPWDSSFSYGPAWYATYTAPTDGSSPPADAVTTSSDSNKLISIFYKSGELTKGGMAAAIIVPLLVVFIAIGIYVRKMHLNRNNKTADWAEHMDKRMSKISLDWTSGGDGTAGPVPGSRPASFMGRPQSSYRPSVEAVRAAYAASVAGRGMDNTDMSHGGEDEMSEAHFASDSMHTTGGRHSNYRVSFAPSTVAGPTSAGHTSRGHQSTTSKNRNSFYQVNNGSPAVPKLDTQRFNNSEMDNSAEDEEFVMSPTQNLGATPVNFEGDEDLRRSMLNYPALEMVDGGEQGDHQVEEEEAPMEDAVEHIARPVSVVKEEEEEESEAYAPDTLVSNHTGMLPPSSSNSPDEALKQYAALRAAAGPPTPSGASPTPSTTMRNLYGAQPVQSSNSIFVDNALGHRAQQGSIATGGGSSINEDDVVGYNEMIDGGHQRY